MTARELALLACAALVSSVAGCGGKDAQSSAKSSPVPSATQSKAADPGATIDVTIADGKVRPAGGEVKVEVGEKIILRVDSDTPDELHVHSEPDHEFEVKVGEGQTFAFTVGVPGQAAVESHHLEKTIVELVVTP